jgi:hypothetical protein
MILIRKRRKTTLRKILFENIFCFDLIICLIMLCLNSYLISIIFCHWLNISIHVYVHHQINKTDVLVNKDKRHSIAVFIIYILCKTRLVLFYDHHIIIAHASQLSIFSKKKLTLWILIN